MNTDSHSHLETQTNIKETYSNQMSKFDHLPTLEDKRFMAFLNWVHDMVSSRTTGKDSYSPNISPETITPGAPVLRKGHVYFVKKSRLVEFLV